ncbi:SRPBCC family protein [Pseudodonghicola xiamenensis]|uniref:Polyketide cyclase / dehydrase and lipid transport n=1 Tax=Pseudodonghicola xiamenensis TaxID=337702 RepID=A0A8J3HCT3_9RHOB|nr:SRPBCC family protein [Pseudodonghicola xiamenensis]GHH02208.1 hypothetical protein GCM10010961_39860 [Pseudodonghicola xiamenensis]
MTAAARIFTDDRGRPAISTEIVIDAPMELVWAVLTDFTAMPQWSDSFLGLEGPFEAGGDVVASFRMFGRITRVCHPLVHWLEGKDRRMFGWTAPTSEGGRILDDHRYIVERLGDGRTRFVQTDAFSNAPRLLAPLMLRLLRRWYMRFNAALKARAEALHVAGVEATV